MWLVPEPKIPPTWSLSSKLTLAIVTSVGKIWLGWLNRTKVENRDALVKLVAAREQGRGLLTVSNHHGCIDDPLLWGALSWRNVLSPSKMRWTPAAEDICFTNNLVSKLFTRGRIIPVIRGKGVYQKCMDFCVEQLNKDGWVHMFPEGKVNLNQDYMRLKWGIGRLISDCKTAPIVLPLFHIGLDSILPNRKPYIPLIRQNVTIYVGSPLEFTKDIEMLKQLKKTPMEIRKHITDIVQEEMKTLREKAELLHKATYGSLDT